MIPNDLEIVNKARLLDYPTPFFYTSKEVLRHNYQTFLHLFDDSEIHYALKANSDPKVLGYLNELGCGFEAASIFEIDILLQLGVKPEKIIYGTAVKPAAHIERAASAGINRFAADSKEEIDKIAKIAPGSKVFIRAIVEDEGSVFTMSERFGAPIETVKELVLYLKAKGLKTYGISFYVGSQAVNTMRWAQGAQSVKPIYEQLLEEGVTLEILNLGGGYPALYANHSETPHLKDIVKQTWNTIHTFPYMPRIIMEPGRGIVASSTVLVTEVIARTTRNGKAWLTLDAGIYNALYEAMVHQGATNYVVHSVTTPEGEGQELMSATLVGPTGDSLDVIARDVPLPSYIGVGDRLIFENAGAYTIAMSSAFNGFPVPELYIG